MNDRRQPKHPLGRKPAFPTGGAAARKPDPLRPIRLTDGSFAERIAGKHGWSVGGADRRGTIVHRTEAKPTRLAATPIHIDMHVRHLHSALQLHIRHIANMVQLHADSRREQVRTVRLAVTDAAERVVARVVERPAAQAPSRGRDANSAVQPETASTRSASRPADGRPADFARSDARRGEQRDEGRSSERRPPMPSGNAAAIRGIANGRLDESGAAIRQTTRLTATSRASIRVIEQISRFYDRYRSQSGIWTRAIDPRAAEAMERVLQPLTDQRLNAFGERAGRLTHKLDAGDPPLHAAMSRLAVSPPAMSPLEVSTARTIRLAQATSMLQRLAEAMRNAQQPSATADQAQTPAARHVAPDSIVRLVQASTLSDVAGLLPIATSYPAMTALRNRILRQPPSVREGDRLEAIRLRTDRVPPQTAPAGNNRDGEQHTERVGAGTDIRRAVPIATTTRAAQDAREAQQRPSGERAATMLRSLHQGDASRLAGIAQRAALLHRLPVSQAIAAAVLADGRDGALRGRLSHADPAPAQQQAVRLPLAGTMRPLPMLDAESSIIRHFMLRNEAPAPLTAMAARAAQAAMTHVSVTAAIMVAAPNRFERRNAALQLAAVRNANPGVAPAAREIMLADRDNPRHSASPRLAEARERHANEPPAQRHRGLSASADSPGMATAHRAITSPIAETGGILARRAAAHAAQQSLSRPAALLVNRAAPMIESALSAAVSATARSQPASSGQLDAGGANAGSREASGRQLPPQAAAARLPMEPPRGLPLSARPFAARHAASPAHEVRRAAQPTPGRREAQQAGRRQPADGTRLSAADIRAAERASRAILETAMDLRRDAPAKRAAMQQVSLPAPHMTEQAAGAGQAVADSLERMAAAHAVRVTRAVTSAQAVHAAQSRPAALAERVARVLQAARAAQSTAGRLPSASADMPGLSLIARRQPALLAASAASRQAGLAHSAMAADDAVRPGTAGVPSTAVPLIAARRPQGDEARAVAAPRETRQLQALQLEVAARRTVSHTVNETVVESIRQSIKSVERELNQAKAEWTKPSIDMNRLADQLFKDFNQRIRHAQQRRGL